MYCGSHLVAVLLGCILTTTSVTASDLQVTAPLFAQGKYISQAAGCYSCHTDRKQNGEPFAGGRALRTPFGTFYSPNITPDTETGIGTWSEQDFLFALRQGLRPDGNHLYPVFPYTAYTKLTDDDSRALWAYLRSLKSVKRANTVHELKWFSPPRALVWFWKQFYFTPGRYLTNPKKSTTWNRGAYLVEAAAHCNECHTPRNMLGGSDSDLPFAGARVVAEDFTAPNITPDRDTGIGKWSTSELVEYLQSGMDPGGDSAGSVMAEVIDDGLNHLREGDLAAITEYIKSLPPIAHSLRKSKEKPERKKEEWE